MFSTNAQSRFASVVDDGVLGPLRLLCHTWRCPCISVVPEATHEASRGPEKGTVSAQKGFKRVRDGDEWVAGRNGREQCFPNEGSLICPPGKSMICYEKETEKNELVARPETEWTSWMVATMTAKKVKLVMSEYSCLIFVCCWNWRIWNMLWPFLYAHAKVQSPHKSWNKFAHPLFFRLGQTRVV